MATFMSRRWENFCLSLLNDFDRCLSMSCSCKNAPVFTVSDSSNSSFTVVSSEERVALLPVEKLRSNIVGFPDYAASTSPKEEQQNNNNVVLINRVTENPVRMVLQAEGAV